jgi:hypothetical protein
VHVAARDYRLTPNHTLFVIDAPGPGVAVVGEAFVPQDFRATLNDRPTPYFLVNHAFKAIVIPQRGTWTVAFEYRPARWALAWMVSAVGVCVLLILAWQTASTRSVF